MFRSTLRLPVKTPAIPFIVPATITVIEPFMQTVGYQGVYDKDYHSINVDIPLVSVYLTENVTVRGMLIPDAFLTDEIHAIDDYKEYEMVFIKKKKRKQVDGVTSSPRKSLKVTVRQKKLSTTLIPPLSDDQERDEISKATLLSLALHKTVIAAEDQENVAKVQEKLAKEEIEKMVEGEKSYVSEFVDSVFNDDDDDSGTRIEPMSHKENPKMMMMRLRRSKKTISRIRKRKNDDEKKDEMGSIETKKEKMHTPIPSPTRSPSKNLFSDKTLSQELINKGKE
uniref:Uncharacterized protein n=1 Tax=Tanacetum cinerariifolium TaxID=118510 RepID=A0A699JHB1_TANCI|nr:hypothetical protein [Tanacetum cinerariifolium]